MKMSILALLILGALALPAQAHIVDLGDNDIEIFAKLVQCDKHYKVSDYREYATKVYSRQRIPQKAKKRMLQMHKCAPKYIQRVKIGHLHTKLQRAWKASLCHNFNPIACIKLASKKFGTSFTWLVSCANTEGGTSKYSYAKMNHQGSGAGGVFQFMKSTFDATISRMGLSPKPWLNAKWQAFAAAWKFRVDGTGEWTGAGC